MATVDQVFSQQGLWKWYAATPTNLWNGRSEKGQDFSNAYGTPIGAVAPGKVVFLQHNNNSINDLVVVQGNSGYWLYQHINAKVNMGDTVGVGTIVGTQNGTPVDQYSTGTHIEVRYLPPGAWKGDISNTWNQLWINPASVFKMIGSQQATQIGPFNLSNDSSSSSSSSTFVPQNCNSWDIGCQLGNFWGGMVAPTLIQWVEYVAIFVIAVVLIIMGFYLVAEKQADALAKTAVKAVAA